MKAELNLNDHALALRWAKKTRATRLLGGVCLTCGCTDIRVLTFHHLSDKEFSICRLLRARWSRIEHEIMKCKLYCANCHGELHYVGENRQIILKRRLLAVYGTDCCLKCGYKKSVASLDFHHIDDKDFGLARKRAWQRMLLEIEKCEVMCRNCHIIEHIDSERLRRLAPLIEEKIQLEVEFSRPIGLPVVNSLLESGLSQIQIARQLGCAKSTITGILKRQLV